MVVAEKSAIVLRPDQKQFVGEIYGSIKAGNKRIACVAATSFGKAQPLTSNVLTPAGFKPMGVIQAGDQVIGKNGKPCRVTGIFPQGIKPVYRVTMSDGSSTLCCDEHLWNVQSSDDRAKKGCDHWRTIPLSEIKKTYSIPIKKKDGTDGVRMKWFIPMIDAVEFYPVKEPLPFDPYAMGLLLGDGSFANSRVMFSCPDVECQESLKMAIPEKCQMLNPKNSTNDFDFLIITPRGERNPMLDLIRELGLSEHRSESKFIPEMYLYASVEDRIAILQGLFDTDGYAVGSGIVEYTTTSSQLKNDVTFLVQSIGGTVKTITKKPCFTHKGERRIGKLSYRMTVKLPFEIEPFRLTRKIEKHLRLNQSSNVARRSIVNVEYVGEQECQCISVDAPDNLYVTDDFIVTHNTVISSQIMLDAASRGRKVLFLVTIDCLISQTIEKLIKFGVTEIGIIAGGYPELSYGAAQIFVASLQSLARREAWLSQHWDLIVFDEAHTSAWFGVADRLFATHSGWILGLTATPFRLSKKQGFGDKFQDAVLSPDMLTLTELGALSPLVYMGLSTPDVSELKLVAGDYKEDDLSRICNTSEAIGNALDGWEQHAKGFKTIAFGVDVKHSTAIASEFSKRGYPAAVVTGSTPREDRKMLFDMLDRGDLVALASCNALSTGFDLPSIECGLLLRPTKSLAMHIQQVGRVARVAPGKTRGLILDAAGNCERLGFPEQISAALTKEIVLSKGQIGGTGEAPVKCCPQCQHLIHASLMTCPHCGFEFEAKKSDRPVAVGAFEQLQNPAYVREGDEEAHKEYYRYLIQKRWKQNNPPSSAFGDYLKQGFHKFPKPGHKWGRHCLYPENTDANCREYLSKLKRFARILKKDEKWITWLMGQEFGAGAIDRATGKKPLKAV